MSQSEVAKLIGVKQQAISRLENKENSPSLKLFFSIVDALGYDVKIEKNSRENKKEPLLQIKFVDLIMTTHLTGGHDLYILYNFFRYGNNSGSTLFYKAFSTSKAPINSNHI